jgi:hypothetical protein
VRVVPPILNRPIPASEGLAPFISTAVRNRPPSLVLTVFQWLPRTGGCARMFTKGVAMPRIGFMNKELDPSQDISVAEVALRSRMLKDTILVYGLAMSIAAFACGAVLYWKL